ncbi:MAG: alpha/beta hydrolase, partial [Candidatus Woesearchaeota archaeon]|nr:alpha/beta hydrolase [Candidatus Woesearchaeota archaeon]
MSERIVFKSQGLNLVGILDSTITDRIIIMAHGFTGDKDMCGKFVEATAHFVKAEFAVFRFDFAGSGESQDTLITLFG